MKEYYLSDQEPKRITDRDLKEFLEAKELIIGAKMHIDLHMAAIDQRHGETLTNKFSQALGEQILQKKIKPQFVDSPLGKYVMGKVIVMDEKDLYDLLSNLGVEVHKIMNIGVL
jgi:hypothetical protein